MISFARELRVSQTPTETILWRHLRNKQLAGLKFRRQQVMGPYIVDFYCAQAKLVVEVDGDVHAIGNQPAKDAERQVYLELRGLTVLRFSNQDVNTDISGVLERILAVCCTPSPHP